MFLPEPAYLSRWRWKLRRPSLVVSGPDSAKDVKVPRLVIEGWAAAKLRFPFTFENDELTVNLGSKVLLAKVVVIYPSP